MKLSLIGLSFVGACYAIADFYRTNIFNMVPLPYSKSIQLSSLSAARSRIYANYKNQGVGCNGTSDGFATFHLLNETLFLYSSNLKRLRQQFFAERSERGVYLFLMFHL